MSEQSKEAFVQQRGSGSHQLHLGSVKSSMRIHVAHLVHRQIQRRMEAVHRPFIGGKRGEGVGRPGTSNRR